MILLESRSIGYDDVNLIAQPQNYLKSRREVPKQLNRIMASPMPSVVGEEFVKAACDLGISVCLHRFAGIDEQIRIYYSAWEYDGIWGSVGLGDYEGIKKLEEAGIRKIVIDVANGYLRSVSDFALGAAKSFPHFRFMVGNIHSADGVWEYRQYPFLYRVGIGGGSVCETSKSATGFGRGAITEISEIREELNKLKLYNPNAKIVADGGIRNAACASKAFGTGADYVMMGGYFARAQEAENVIQGDYKHWGCASDFNQKKFGEKRNHSEGKVEDVKMSDIVPLKDLVDELWGGISSAVSYSGFQSLDGFIGNGTFEIKQKG